MGCSYAHLTEPNVHETISVGTSPVQPPVISRAVSDGSRRRPRRHLVRGSIAMAHAPERGVGSPIRLVLADVDGTLVTSEKVLTERSVEAVRRLDDAGIAFAVTSGRPPRGMQMLVEPL